MRDKAKVTQKQIEEIEKIKKRFYSGNETAEDVAWIFKQLEEVANIQNELEMLQVNTARIINMIDNFAFRNYLRNAREQWEKNNYKEIDKLPILIKNFLKEVESYIPTPPESEKWF